MPFPLALAAPLLGGILGGGQKPAGGGTGNLLGGVVGGILKTGGPKPGGTFLGNLTRAIGINKTKPPGLPVPVSTLNGDMGVPKGQFVSTPTTPSNTGLVDVNTGVSPIWIVVFFLGVLYLIRRKS